MTPERSGFTVALAIAGILAPSSACNWGDFDDLADRSWVRVVDRDDSQSSGDFGFNVIAVPLPAGKRGVGFVLGVAATGTLGAGLAHATFDETGELAGQ